ncbi:MAG TPA: hypothetical protein DEA08_22070, partial [Planctomycetes bacterium]|nr:hypothetical protein [Planctomycetota bacterium]
QFIHSRYGPTLDWALRNRYVVATLTVAFLILVAGLVASGRPKFIFFPRLDADTIQANVTMPEGTSYETTAAVIDRIEAAAEQLNEGLPLAYDGKPIARRIKAKVGGGSVNTGNVELELVKSELRDITHLEVVKRWKKLVGPLPEVAKLSFDGTRHRPGGRPIELRIMPRNPAHSEPIALALRDALASYPGVFNIDDNLQPGKRELRLALRPEAQTLGLSERDLALQLQAGFTGREVMTLQRGREEVEVRVRYAREERRRQEQLDALRLRVSDGRLRLDLCYLALAKRRLPDAVREERAARGATSHGTPLRLLLAYLELARRGERIGHALAVQAWSQLPLRRPPLEVGLLYVPAEAVRAREVGFLAELFEDPTRASSAGRPALRQLAGRCRLVLEVGGPLAGLNRDPELRAFFRALRDACPAFPYLLDLSDEVQFQLYFGCLASPEALEEGRLLRGDASVLAEVRVALTALRELAETLGAKATELWQPLLDALPEEARETLSKDV